MGINLWVCSLTQELSANVNQNVVTQTSNNVTPQKKVSQNT